MTTPPDVRLTPEEYLRIERAAEWKSEYIDGEMFAMAGASPRHVLITGNLVRELGNLLREGPCTVYPTDLRVATDRLRHYTYPDVVVVCEPVQFVDGHQDTITNPTLIAEVLSESTEKYDRGAKFERYRSVPTLAEYLLVSQERIHIELYTRQPNEGWVLREWNDPGAAGVPPALPGGGGPRIRSLPADSSPVPPQTAPRSPGSRASPGRRRRCWRD